MEVYIGQPTENTRILIIDSFTVRLTPSVRISLSHFRVPNPTSGSGIIWLTGFLSRVTANKARMKSNTVGHSGLWQIASNWAAQWLLLVGVASSIRFPLVFVIRVFRHGRWESELPASFDSLCLWLFEIAHEHWRWFTSRKGTSWSFKLALLIGAVDLWSGDVRWCKCIRWCFAVSTFCH